MSDDRGTVRPGTAHEGPERPDAARQGPVQRDAVWQGPVQPDAARQGPVQPDAARQGPVQPDPARQGPVQPDPARQGPVQPDPARQGPVQPDPARQGPVQPDPARQGPVTALLDATGMFFRSARDAFPGAGPADWAAAAALDPGSVGPDGAWRLDFRCFAVADPGGTGWTLIDAGVGPAEGPGAPWCPVPGRLPELLTEAGIDRGDVHTVVLTHLHEDHTGWAADAAGRPFFPDARYVVQSAETAALDRSDPVWSWVVEPLRSAGQLHEVDGTHRLRPGVTLLPTPGHTPGHQSVLVERADGRDVLVTGDLLVHAVQLAAPAVAYAHERDPATARASREKLLARAVERGAVLATAHLTRPFVAPPGSPAPS